MKGVWFWSKAYCLETKKTKKMDLILTFMSGQVHKFEINDEATTQYFNLFKHLPIAFSKKVF